MEFKEYNENYGRPEFGVNIEESLSKLSAVESVRIAVDLTKENLPELSAAAENLLSKNKLVKEFVETAMGDKSETVMQKLTAAALVVAKNKGLFPGVEKIDPIKLANTVNVGATHLKTAYKVANGEMDASDATDVLIDATAVRLSTIAERAIEVSGPVVIDRICMALSTHPYTAMAACCIKTFEKPILTATKVGVRKGISAIANVAKPVVAKTISTGRTIVNKVVNFLFA